MFWSASLRAGITTMIATTIWWAEASPRIMTRHHVLRTEGTGTMFWSTSLWTVITAMISTTIRWAEAST